jgi:DNA-binding GntR family transcriptional regulator
MAGRASPAQRAPATGAGHGLHLERLARGRPSPRRQASHEWVADVLRQAITSGQLRANDPLPQQEIAARLHVSHIPVREALRQLQSEGLVTYQPNRGAAVTAHTPGEIREIYEIRVILETAAIRDAAARLPAGALDRAEKLLDEAERSRDPIAWGAHDLDFHRILYGLEERPRLRELIDGLLARVDRYWLVHGLSQRDRKAFEADHRALLAAVRARDGERAARLLAQHLGGAAEKLCLALARQA